MDKYNRLFDLDKLHKNGITGSNVTIAILDTGIFPHRDLSDNILFFKDFVNGRTKPYDDNSHGTHVSGIICGMGKLNKRYTGIAPSSKIVAIKVLDKTGHCSQKTFINGVNWLLANFVKYKIKIVNISIGTKATSCEEERSSLIKAIDTLWDNGIFVIASAGNNGPEKNTITIPGISRRIITVGSCEWKNEKTDSSQFRYSGKGPTYCNILKPDIVTPGDSITSCLPGNYYGKKSGTSMSTPVVSGTAALLLSKYPYLDNESFKNYLKISAIDLGLDKYTQGMGQLSLNNLFSLFGLSIH